MIKTTMIGAILLLLVTIAVACSGPKPASVSSQSVTVNISAQNIAFDKRVIKVPGGADVTIVFENKDRVPHNVAVYETQAAAKPFFVGELIAGPKTITYRFTAPTNPGTYFFRCDPHPRVMTGDFIVTTS